MRGDNSERHRDFPDVWSAILILALLIGIEILIAAGFRDAGARFGRGDPKYMGIITVFACGIVFSLLLSYKNLGYGELFHASSRSVNETMRPLVMRLALTRYAEVGGWRRAGDSGKLRQPGSERRDDVIQRLPRA